MEISEVFKIAEKQLNQTNTELEFKKVNEDEKSITFAGEKGAYRIAYDMQASTMAFECCPKKPPPLAMVFLWSISK